MPRNLGFAAESRWDSTKTHSSKTGFAHNQHGTMRVRENVLNQPVATIRLGICEAIEKVVSFGIFHEMVQVTFLLVTEGFTIADEKLEVSCVRLVNSWIVDLFDDAVTQREP